MIIDLDDQNQCFFGFFFNPNANRINELKDLLQEQTEDTAHLLVEVQEFFVKNYGRDEKSARSNLCKDVLFKLTPTQVITISPML